MTSLVSRELRRCAQPRCNSWTMWRRCERHETAEDRARRAAADDALVAMIVARDAWRAALEDDDPAAVAETARVMRAATEHLERAEAAAGMSWPPGGEGPWR